MDHREEELLREQEAYNDYQRDLERKEYYEREALIDHLCEEYDLVRKPQSPATVDGKEVTIICATVDKDGNSETTETKHFIPAEKPKKLTDLQLAHGDVAEVAYWDFVSRQDHTQTDAPQSERDAFKQVFRKYFTTPQPSPASDQVAAYQDMPCCHVDAAKVHWFNKYYNVVRTALSHPAQTVVSIDKTVKALNWINSENGLSMPGEIYETIRALLNHAATQGENIPDPPGSIHQYHEDD